MSASRLWTIGAVVVILALLAGTWFIGISPRLTEIATAESSKQTVMAVNSSHEATLVHLKALKEKLPELKTELEELHESIPVEAEQADFVRNVENAAASSGVKDLLQQYDDALFYVPPADVPADAEFAAAVTSVGDSKLVVIPVKISVTGTRAQTFAMINRLQFSSRLFLVHDITYDEGYGALDSVVQTHIMGQIFVFLDAAVAGAVADSGTGGTGSTTDPSGPQPE